MTFAHSRVLGGIMKRNLSKIFASSSIVVAVILVMILLVTAFGGITQEEFDSKLVQGLLITLAILYIALSIVTLVLIFINNDVLKDITLRSDRGGAAKVSVAVIKKMVKSACVSIEGVKGKKVAVVSDDYGAHLKVSIKVVDKDVVEAEVYLRTLLEDMFTKEFGYSFQSIDVRVMALESKYKADENEINTRVEARLQELRAEMEDKESNDTIEAVDDADDTVGATVAEDAQEAEDVAPQEVTEDATDEQNVEEK